MQHVWNAHAGGAADQSLKYSSLIQEHGYEANSEGCVGCDSVCGDAIQHDRE